MKSEPQKPKETLLDTEETHSDETELELEDETVPQEFLCPLTMDVMKDPVVTKYGQSYEREAILEWLVGSKTDPMTRQPLRLRDIITNHNLKLQIRNWQPSLVFQGSNDELSTLAYLDLSDLTERMDDPATVYEWVRPTPPPPRRRRWRFLTRFRRRPQVTAGPIHSSG